MRRVRFWFWGHDWTRLTLREGHTLRWTSGGANEEGYDVTAHEWSWPRGCTAIFHEVSRSARDCDGPLTSGFVDFAELTEGPGPTVATDWNPTRERQVPRWQEDTPYRQRDYYAEAMGY